MAWLDTVKTGANKIGQINIGILKQNLDFSEVSILPKDSRWDLLIIPVRSPMNGTLKLDKTVTLHLLLVMDKAGKIKSGNIIGFSPSDKGKNAAVSPVVLQSFYSNKPVTEDGMYIVFGVAGRKLFQLTYKNKKLTSVGVLQSDKKDKSKVVDGCTDWYLVTTYYYADGSSDSTSEYVGTTCNDAEDLPSDGGGGGDTNTTEVTDDVTYSDVDQEYSSGDYSATDGYISISYSYHAQIFRDADTREIYSALMYPVTADPMVSWYVDQYGRTVNRVLTLWGQYNSYTILSATSVLLNWSCTVTARYAYSDGSPAWTRNWPKSYSAVRN
jgi:hypothetical protein